MLENPRRKIQGRKQTDERELRIRKGRIFVEKSKEDTEVTGIQRELEERGNDAEKKERHRGRKQWEWKEN